MTEMPSQGLHFSFVLLYKKKKKKKPLEDKSQ